MTPEFRHAIERGVAAHQAGRLEDALADYDAALAIAPDEAEANSLRGLALLHLDRVDEAGPPLERAAELEPAEVGLQLNFVEFLERSGQLERAEQVLDRVLVRRPSSTRLWEKKGDVCMRRQHYPDAVAAYISGAKLDLHSFPLTLKVAKAYLALGDHASAQRALDRAQTLRPDEPEALEPRAALMRVQQDWRGLENVSVARVNREPDNGAAWQDLALATFEQGRHRVAVEAFEKALGFVPRSAANLTAYARSCLHALRYEAAAEALDEAQALEPELIDMLSVRSLLLTYLGRTAEAETCIRRWLDLDPTNGSAYTQLARVTGGRLTDGEMDVLSAVSANDEQPIDNRIAATFALAHAYDARQDYPTAFSTYQRANVMSLERAKAEGMIYDPTANRARVRRIMSLFPATTLTNGEPTDGPRPVFVVGMPRSGTTLVEGMLSAHSRVRAGGERPLMPLMLNAYLAIADANKQPGRELLRKSAKKYLDEIAAPGHEDHVTDKNPLNLEAAGFIARLFPDAAIVHVRRAPLDNGLSVFRHEPNRLWPFANTLEDIGHYQGECARLAAHWQRTLGERFITVQYEDLATDFDTAAPALIAACGLPWEEACREFQRNASFIATPSAAQAREPVSARRDRAREYETRLEPLVDALRAVDVDLSTGALAGS